MGDIPYPFNELFNVPPFIGEGVDLETAVAWVLLVAETASVTESQGYILIVKLSGTEENNVRNIETCVCGAGISNYVYL